MKSTSRTLKTALATWALALTSAHAATGPAVQTEIQSLLSSLQSANCQFNRNGTWYNAGEARQHMQRKVDYFEEHGGFKSTEQFIELVATKSSVSGDAYQVRCGQANALPSAQWMSGQLGQLRGKKPS